MKNKAYFLIKQALEAKPVEVSDKPVVMGFDNLDKGIRDSLIDTYRDIHRDAIKGQFGVTGTGMGFRFGSNYARTALKNYFDFAGNKGAVKYLEEKDPSKRDWLQYLAQKGVDIGGGIVGALAGRSAGRLAAVPYDYFTSADTRDPKGRAEYEAMLTHIFKDTPKDEVAGRVNAIKDYVDKSYNPLGNTSKYLGNVIGGYLGSYGANKAMDAYGRGYDFDHKKGWSTLGRNAIAALVDTLATSAGVGAGGYLSNMVTGTRLSPLPYDYYTPKAKGEGGRREYMDKMLDNWVWNSMLPGRYITNPYHTVDKGERDISAVDRHNILREARRARLVQQ